VVHLCRKNAYVYLSGSLTLLRAKESWTLPVGRKISSGVTFSLLLMVLVLLRLVDAFFVGVFTWFRQGIFPLALVSLLVLRSGKRLLFREG